MFHLQYPASKNFMTWDELGCLSRALGFTSDLFKNYPHTNDVDITFDNNGMDVKSILRVLELNLLCSDLHLTYNMHTADWNTRAIRSALSLLLHRVLNFDDLRNARVAYETYEHTDMKGMGLNTLVIGRALKLCGRVIGPLKLKHRLKHMRPGLLEPDRIQLDEFFRLILWCDLHQAYSHNDIEQASGKDGDMYQMVDFDRLLTHHDERLANRLNAQFLQEERDYGTERLGPRDMFTDSTINREFTTEEIKLQKINYQPLQLEVIQSEIRVHKAHAGNVRPRPINVPDLDSYRQSGPFKSSLDLRVQSACGSVHRRLHSAPPISQRPKLCLDVPQASDTARQATPRSVSPRDLRDVQRKLENLLFDMSTAETRCQVQVENEMMFYIPGYLQKLANKLPNTEGTLPPQPTKKQRHWTNKIIQGLVCPPSALNRTHAKTCDARFRGWRKINSTLGYNCVLTSQTHSSSKPDTISKSRPCSSASRLPVRPDYVIRYTPRIRSSPQCRRRTPDDGLLFKQHNKTHHEPSSS